MPDEIMKAFGPAIGQAPIPPMPVTSSPPQLTPGVELYPPIKMPELLPELTQGAQNPQSEVAATVADPALSENVGEAAGFTGDMELVDDSISAAAATAAVAVDTIVEPGSVPPTVPEVVHDHTPSEVQMSQEQVNYLNMLPPMAKNLLGTILTSEHQLFLSDTTNQNPIKAMSFFMTKEARETVRHLVDMYAQYCKQFD